MNQWVYDDFSQYYDFEVKRLVLVSSRDDGYQDMFIKPYVSKVTNVDLENMIDRFIKVGKINPEDSEMLGIGAGIVGKAGITGGWGFKRYTFVLEVKCKSQRSASYSELMIGGYTDPCENFVVNNFSPNFDKFNMDLVFHINYCKKMDQDHSGGLIDVTDLGVMDDNSLDPEVSKSLRPSDIVTNLQMKNIASDLKGINKFVGNKLNDYNSTFNRRHNSSTQYMTSIFDAVAQNTEDKTINDFNVKSEYRRQTNSLLHGAATTLSNISINDLPFIRLLNSSVESPGVNKFNIRSLISVCRNLHPQSIVCVDVPNTSAVESGSFVTASRDNTLTFNSINPYNTIVQDIHNMFVTFMLSNYLGSIDVVIHNNRGQDEMPFERPKAKYCIQNLSSIRPTEQKDQQIFMGVINNNLNGLCKIVDKYLNKHNSNINYHIALNMSVGIDSTIMLEINGYDAYGNLMPSSGNMVFRFPTFGDMNFTPMAGNDYNVERLSSDIEQVIAGIQSSL